jgi:hypothetical protein
MSEKGELAVVDKGAEAYRRMVERIVRENFAALDAPGESIRREVAEMDLKENTDLDQLEHDLGQIDTVLEGFWYVADGMDNVVLQLFISDARESARAALELVREHREEWG